MPEVDGVARAAAIGHSATGAAHASGEESVRFHEPSPVAQCYTLDVPIPSVRPKRSDRANERRRSPSMKKLATFVFVAVLASSTSAFASEAKPANELPSVNVAGFCPIGEYKASKIDVNLAIPDDDTTGIDTPNIKFNPQPGVVITDVVIDLEIGHTFVGDLIVTLIHTDDFGTELSCDLINRPGVPEGMFGCGGNLVGNPEAKYYFATRSDLEAIGEPDCKSDIAAGCYSVAPESGAGNGLEIFRGLPQGSGLWRLHITDNAGGDVGFVYNWSVHLLCQTPVSLQDESWGSVKAFYQD
jgi:hypothetical protein